MSKKTLNKWLVLTLGSMIQAFVLGTTWTVMPVLFPAASKELGLSLGQVGLIWGMLPLGAASFAMFGGMIGDRMGFVKTIGISCFVVAAVNVLRGIAPNMPVLAISMFLLGAAEGLVFPNVQKTGSLFFKGSQIALAMGIIVAGFAIGGILTTVFSANVLINAVGSWRNVIFFYSVLAALCGVLWFALLRNGEVPGPATDAPQVTFQSCIKSVLRIKEVWLMALGNVTIIGSFIALNGYFPTFLQALGLPQSMGDTMSSTLFFASIIGALAIPILADKLHAGKTFLVACAVITAAVVAVCAIAPSWAFWILIPLAGIVTQGLGTVVLNETMAIKQIGTAYGGTALGFMGSMGNLGGFVMPLIGGTMAESNKVFPFYLWAAICIVGVMCFAVLLRPARKTTKATAAFK
jgi:MFS family permease